jgi:hypothetical protein
MKRIFYTTIAFLFTTISLFAQVSGDYRSTGNVLLTTAANWQTYDGTAWVTATQSPSAATLASGNTISVLAGHTWSSGAANNTATIPLGVSLLVQGVVGTLNANTLVLNGTYIHNTTSGVANVFTGLAGNAPGTTSTFIYRASTGVTPASSLNGRTYNNLVFDTDGSLATPPSFSTPGIAADLTVNGDLTINFWSVSMPTSGANGLTATNYNGNISVLNGATFITRNATIAAGKTLLVDATSKLGIGATASGTTTATLTINGSYVNRQTTAAITFAGATPALVINGTYQHDANGGNCPNANTTYGSASTILVSGVVNPAAIPVLPTTCANVIWNCPNQTASNTFVNTTSNTTTVNGNITFVSTGTGTIYMGGGGASRTLTVNGNLTVSGGRLAVIFAATSGGTADQYLNVNGDVTVSAGQFNVSNSGGTSTGKGYLNVTGNLTHTGGVFGSMAAANPQTGIVTFTGTNTDKTISVSNPLVNTIIALKKTGSITLNSNLLIGTGSVLTDTLGKLVIAGGNTLEIAAGSGLVAASGDFGASKYFVSGVSGNNVGKLKINGMAASTLFPVGSATNYLPVTLTPSTSSDFTVGVFENITVEGIPTGTAFDAARKAVVVNAVWQVNRDAGTGNTTMRTGWVSSLEGATFSTFTNANVGISQKASSDWGIAVTNGNSDNTSNFAEAVFSDFSLYTSFGVGRTGTTLPVKFSSIRASLKGNTIAVEWGVANDKEIVKYEVEKSKDASGFRLLQTVNAKGLNNAEVYDITDANLFEGNNFYRVKAYGKDGDIRYSDMVRVNTAASKKDMLTVYPNPVINKTIHIALANVTAGNYGLTLTDASGKQVYTKQLGNISGNQGLSVQLNNSVVPGIYHLSVQSSSTVIKQTVFVK